MNEINLDLPFPPSFNRVWRQFKGRTILSKEYRQWKTEAYNMLNVQWITLDKPDWLSERLAVEIYLQPGDNRRWDVDNRTKAVLDALEATWIKNDNQIDHLSVTRLPKDFPACWIRLFPMRDIETRALDSSHIQRCNQFHGNQSRSTG